MCGSNYLLLLVTAFLFQCVLCDNNVGDGCSVQVSCSACIQTPNCCWCSKNKDSHCNLANVNETCSDGSECYNPRPERISAEEINKEFGVTGSETVQIRPQKVKLKLRVGESYDLNVQYEQATDYPVDLYYLMDLSNSMKDDKESLSQLGNKLADAMKKLTKNFKMGFGSFVDKVTMPFVSTVPAKLKEPCEGCVSPYSFKNHLPLNNNTSEFSEKVEETSVSGNLDSPEGGFDAVMQAMVCTNQIGWRSKARHLLVFSTDATFHLAGDGKLAGIILPNDGECHLAESSDGVLEYNKYLEYDYPSISQLNEKAQKHDINIIFAVTEKQRLLYEALQHRITGASSGVLDADSKNVIKLVQDQYEKLVDSVTLDNNNNEYMKVQYFTNCLDASQKPYETKTCQNTRVNRTINYTAKIEVVKCPTNKTQTLVIKPVGVNENLIVEIDIICDCPCATPGNEGYVEEDADCSNSPSKCGVCSCNPDRSGPNCECQADEMNSGDDKPCMDDKNVTCSSRGTCVCGECKCTKTSERTFSGKFCECDDGSCLRSKGQLCQGNGDCKCGECVCKAPWTGDDCSCYGDTSQCKQPGSNDECSGKGTCVCGMCICTDKKTYSGAFCEVCRTCPGRRCDELSTCVECLAYANNEGAKCENLKCEEKVTLKLVDDLGEDDSSNGRHKCIRADDAGCTFGFIYDDTAKTPITVEVQKAKDCGAAVNILAIVLGITGGTVIIGLLSLIAWKILTNIHDRMEYVKFEKERALSKFDRGDNPLYKPSTSTFNNPTFGNK